MKARKRIKDIRNEEADRRRELWSSLTGTNAARTDEGQQSKITTIGMEQKQQRVKTATTDRASKRANAAHLMLEKLDEEESESCREADTREFLELLERETIFDIFDKEEKPQQANRRKKELIRTLNIEQGMPTVDEAIQHLHFGLKAMHSSKTMIVRVIHGYGSTGKGGIIREEIRSELHSLFRKGAIKDYIIGEEFGPFSESARNLIDRFPEVTKDQDFGRCNHGITIVLV